MPLLGNRYSFLIVASAVLLIATAFGQDNMVQQSARAAGMAGAYSCIGNDVNSISVNSAGLMRLDRTQLVGSYTRYYTGADIPGMNEGSLFFSPYTWGKMFYGVGVSYFMHEIFSQQKATVTLGSELWRMKRTSSESMNARLSFAVNGNLYRVGYSQANFSDDFDPNDPLFRDGYDKIAYSADANLLAEFGPLSVGLGGYNLLEPDISLRGGAEGGVYPRTVRGGLSYDILGYVTPAIEIEIPVTANQTVSDEMTYAIGAESWFVGKMLGARAGVSSDFATMGLSFRTRGSWDIGIDYALQFPFDTPIEIGQTHKVSFEVGMAKPFKVITDFIVEQGSVEPMPKFVSVGEDAVVTATIANIGKMDAKNVPVTVYYIVDGQTRVIERMNIDQLPSGGKEKITFSFIPPQKGYYDIFVAANDLGGKVPALQKKILETDYDNNTGSARLASFMPPETGTIRTSRDELRISTVSKIREEIPMIPTVHFDLNSANVSKSRFGPMLEIVAKRLKENPDTKLSLYGYFDKNTESQDGLALSIDRANSVKKELVAYGADPNQIEIVTDGYDSSTERVSGVSAKDRAMIEEENRVVEMQVKIQGPTLLGSYNYESDDFRPSREAREDLKTKIENTLKTLERNSDLYLVFHGFTAGTEKENRRDAYIRSANFREIALDWVPNWLVKRMLVVSSEGYDEYPHVDAYVTGDALIFRPHGTSLSGETLEFGELGSTDIIIDTIMTETQIDSHAVIIREQGTDVPFAVVKTGRGTPPNSVPWNWFGDRGQAPDPEKKYFAEVYIVDEFGQAVSAISNPINIKVDEQEERKELFLINFNFGKSQATSEYLEARVENLAKSLVDRVKYLGPNARIEARVIGHTDIVGSDERNEQLSWERARKEYDNLIHGLMTLLDIKTEAEVLAWLEEHRVKLTYEGRNYKDPMAISRFEEGYWRREVIGDNRLPEGRLVNRRVVLEIITITE
jgi:outer membrane protein OmpA-like peptidoglycan-associated protein